MIRKFFHAQARKMARAYNYDTSYMHEIIDISPGAAWGLSRLPAFYKYRGTPAGQIPWTGALLASTLDGDCGPCAQLVVDMALAAGAEADALQACAEGRPLEAGDRSASWPRCRACGTGCGSPSSGGGRPSWTATARVEPSGARPAPRPVSLPNERSGACELGLTRASSPAPAPRSR